MDEQMKTPLLAVVGPTASGKTRLAVELALALDGEVISADSMQVYRRMEIATAKPSEEEMRGIPHHLLDFIEPDDATFSVADYAKLARETIVDIAGRGKLPILAGGTGLYVNAVVNNIDYAEIRTDPKLRQSLHEQAQLRGAQEMFLELSKIDPELAAGMHPNNIGRVLRALEVYTLTGIPLSEHQRRSRLTPPNYRLCMLGLCFSDREKLYERINLRVDQMLSQGLEAEAHEVSRIYAGTARQAIGYKELEPYLKGEDSLENCVQQLKQATRKYAKRQLTWFQRDERIHWLAVDSFSDWQDLLDTAKNTVHNCLNL